MSIENERLTLKAKRAEKQERIETLRIKASSMVVQIRRSLGGQYVDDILTVDVDEARVTMADLQDVVREAKQLQNQVREISRKLGDAG